MKRKSPVQSAYYNRSIDGLDEVAIREDVLALHEARRLLDSLRNANCLASVGDTEVDQSGGNSLDGPFQVDSRKRVKVLPSIEAPEDEDNNDDGGQRGRHLPSSYHRHMSSDSDSTAYGSCRETPHLLADYAQPEQLQSGIQDFTFPGIARSKTWSSFSHVDGESPTPSQRLSVQRTSSGTSSSCSIKNSADPGIIDFHDSHLEKRDPQIIINDVLDIISSPAKSGPRHTGNLYQEGYIYVLHDPNYPEYVKIGRTTQRPTQRNKQIASCSRISVNIVGGDEVLKVSYHERLEMIIHADLYNERCHFECTCGAKRHHTDPDQGDVFTKHGEWFRIDVDEAVRRVEQWREWMRQEPYRNAGTAGEGHLKLYWGQRVKYCLRNNGPVLEEPKKRWEMFMTPLYLIDLDPRTDLGDLAF